MRSGEFARFCGTTKNTLIHYDQIGLLKPSAVHENGYRDYTMADYQRFLVIRSFVDAGFSLEQVSRMIDNMGSSNLSELSNSIHKKVKRQIQELKDSERTLDELMRQLSMARSVRFADGSASKPRVFHRDKRWMLASNRPCDMRPGDPIDDLWADTPEALSVLKLAGPEAAVSPYGLSGTCSDGKPRYDSYYFLLPDDAKISGQVKKAVDGSEAMRLETIEEGNYCTLDYFGPWEEVDKAFCELWSYAKRKGLILGERFMETSICGFLDLNADELYRCRIEMLVRD